MHLIQYFNEKKVKVEVRIKLHLFMEDRIM